MTTVAEPPALIVVPGEGMQTMLARLQPGTCVSVKLVLLPADRLLNVLELVSVLLLGSSSRRKDGIVATLGVNRKSCASSGFAAFTIVIWPVGGFTLVNVQVTFAPGVTAMVAARIGMLVVVPPDGAHDAERFQPHTRRFREAVARPGGQGDCFRVETGVVAWIVVQKERRKPMFEVNMKSCAWLGWATFTILILAGGGAGLGRHCGDKDRGTGKRQRLP